MTRGPAETDLPFAAVKRLLAEADPEARWSPEAVEAALRAAEAYLGRIGKTAAQLRSGATVQGKDMERALGGGDKSVVQANRRLSLALAQANLQLQRAGKPKVPIPEREVVESVEAMF